MTRHALVSGGARGIGQGIARSLLAEKVVDRVTVVDLLDLDPVTDAGRGACRALRCDVTDPEQVARLLDDVDGEIHVLVNNVGGEGPPVAAVDDVAWPPVAVWQDIVGLNLTSAYALTRAVRERLAAGGSVCNVASIAGMLPWAVSPAYGAAKAALIHWTQTLAVALAPRGVRANAVAPGFVRTWQWRSVDDAEFAEIVADRVPLAAAGSKEQRAEDIGTCVAFLSSDRARHVTGQVLAVDGGAALTRAPR